MGSTIGRAPHTGQISGADIPESVITTAHIGNASIQGEDLAANVYVDTTGNIATTGTLNAGTTTVDSFKQNSTKTLSGTYADHEVIIADSFQFSGDLIINDNLVLSKLSDDGNAISLTPDGSGDTTITGTGQLETSTIAQTPVTSITGMTGTLGSGVTLDSPTGTLASSVTGSPALNLSNTTGKVDSTQLPSGTCLQAKAMTINEGIPNISGSGTEFVQSDGSYSASFNGALTPLTFTMKQNGSTVLMMAQYHIYYTSSNVSGVFASNRLYFRWATTGPGTLSNYTQFYAVNNYQDCRSTNNVSGQEMDYCTGMHLITPGLLAGDSLYFGVEIQRHHSGAEKGGYIQVMEIAA